MKLSPLILVSFVLCCGTILSAQNIAMPVHLRVNVAHRGASFDAPENTLSAYRLAISAGANGAECDVHATSDGVIVLSHDQSTKRTLGGNGDVTKTTFEELRKLDAGAWKNEKFKGEKIPTLEEYLEVLKGTTCHPVIEIKMEGIERQVLDAVRKFGMTDVSTIIAFSPKVVREVRRLEPGLCVAWLYSENLKDKGTPEENADRLAKLLIDRAKELDTNVLDLNYGILSRPLVKKLQDAGIHVWCWTVNDPGRMNILLDYGVESITTDRPDVLAEVLKTR